MEEFRVADLTVGSWVNVKHAHRESTNERVKGVNKNGVVIVNHFFDAENISPIPLTTEILVKNGWEWHDADAKFFSETWVGSLLLRKEEEGFRILAVSDYDDEDTNDTPFTIRFVHELQHALRLFGTEKEIEL